MRLLAIYGPSGSGKSSLARAGLVPELVRSPLLGFKQARVAVLTPGAHPLDALAAVLARIATNDSAPVAKTREFREELDTKNKRGKFDGPRRHTFSTQLERGRRILGQAAAAERQPVETPES